MSACLDTGSMFEARLLFRWMDASGTGFLTLDDFNVSAERMGLDVVVVESLFAAADIYGQGYVDFKNFVAILFDPSSMGRDELDKLLKAMLNRMTGARACAMRGSVHSVQETGEYYESLPVNVVKAAFQKASWAVQGKRELEDGLLKLEEHLRSAGKSALTTEDGIHLLLGNIV